MASTEFWLSALGILLSIVFGVIGYRQTFGASKERSRIANQQIVEAILKRLILEDVFVTEGQYALLVKGRALDARVSPGKLYDYEDALAIVYDRIFANDYITTEQRSKLLREMDNITSRLAEPEEEEHIVDNSDSPHSSARASLAGLAVSASAAGTAFIMAFLIAAGTSFSRTLTQTSLMFLVSLVILSGIFLTFRTREKFQPHSAVTLSEHPNLERRVRNLFVARGYEVTKSPEAGGYDFSASKGSKRVLVEIRNWDAPMHQNSLARAIARRLAQNVERTGATYGVLVTRGRVALSEVPPTVQVVSLRDLARLLHEDTA